MTLDDAIGWIGIGLALAAVVLLSAAA